MARRKKRAAALKDLDLTKRVIAACHASGVERLHQMSSLKAGQGPRAAFLHEERRPPDSRAAQGLATRIERINQTDSTRRASLWKPDPPPDFKTSLTFASA